MTGNWPVGQIDHIDGDKANNRWTNLRLASQAQQNMNSKTRRDGLKGAYPYARGWRAQIGNTHLGVFVTEIEAHRAYLIAADRLYGEYAFERSRSGQAA